MSTPLSFMSLSTPRVPAGTLRDLTCLQDVVVGACLVCIKSHGSARKDKEYTVMSVSPSRIELSARGSKFGLRATDVMECFQRRLGPVVPAAVRRGLVVKSTYDGKDYKSGEVVTLTETAGSVFEFRDGNNRRGRVEKQELLTSFIFV